jgi:hypothetical protein
MSDIFISYEKSDLSQAKTLAQRLTGCGWTVFWDRKIPAGSTWRKTIGKELDAARCVVVLWSNASIDSGWVQEEADDAKRRGILVPVLIENIQPPIGFRSIQAGNLANWDGTESAEAFQTLITDITGLIGPPPKIASDVAVRIAEFNIGVPLRVESNTKLGAETRRKAAKATQIAPTKSAEPPRWSFAKQILLWFAGAITGVLAGFAAASALGNVVTELHLIVSAEYHNVVGYNTILSGLLFGLAAAGLGASAKFLSRLPMLVAACITGCVTTWAVLAFGILGDLDSPYLRFWILDMDLRHLGATYLLSLAVSNLSIQVVFLAWRLDGLSKFTVSKSRRYAHLPENTPKLIADIKFWLESTGFDTQLMSMEDDGQLLQIKKRGEWRTFLGMAMSLNIAFYQSGDTLTVQIGAGHWIDKIAAGSVLFFVFFPLAIMAAVGAWQQVWMPDKIFDYIGSRLAYK